MTTKNDQFSTKERPEEATDPVDCHDNEPANDGNKSVNDKRPTSSDKKQSTSNDEIDRSLFGDSEEDVRIDKILFRDSDRESSENDEEEPSSENSNKDLNYVVQVMESCFDVMSKLNVTDSKGEELEKLLAEARDSKDSKHILTSANFVALVKGLKQNKAEDAQAKLLTEMFSIFGRLSHDYLTKEETKRRLAMKKSHIELKSQSEKAAIETQEKVAEFVLHFTNCQADFQRQRAKDDAEAQAELAKAKLEAEAALAADKARKDHQLALLEIGFRAERILAQNETEERIVKARAQLQKARYKGWMNGRKHANEMLTIKLENKLQRAKMEVKIAEAYTGVRLIGNKVWENMMEIYIQGCSQLNKINSHEYKNSNGAQTVASLLKDIIRGDQDRKETDKSLQMDDMLFGLAFMLAKFSGEEGKKGPTRPQGKKEEEEKKEEEKKEDGKKEEEKKEEGKKEEEENPIIKSDRQYLKQRRSNGILDISVKSFPDSCSRPSLFPFLGNEENSPIIKADRQYLKQTRSGGKLNITIKYND